MPKSKPAHMPHSLPATATPGRMTTALRVSGASAAPSGEAARVVTRDRRRSVPPRGRAPTPGEARGTTGLAGLAVPLLILLAALIPGLAEAHGFAGKRFFPVTLNFRDPISNEEFDTLYGHVDNQGRGIDATDADSLSVYYSKRVTPSVALSVGGQYDILSPHAGAKQYGFRTLNFAGKFIGHIDPEDESVWSYGVTAQVGGYGSAALDYSTVTPTLYFGKGLGNLPEHMKLLRPLAVTGAIGVQVPTHGQVSRNLVTDFSLQYSDPYLQSFVTHNGLPALLRNSVFLVELPITTCLDQGCKGQYTGTVNPGIALVNFAGQIAVEASIPLNDRTGNSVGVLLQAHMYLDNLFPHTIGKSIFQ